MVYRLIVVLIVCIVCYSSVLCSGNLETGGDYSRFHDRSKRKIADEECIPPSRPSTNNFSQLYDFADKFSRLNAGLENASSTSGDVVIFVGDAGTGKRSVVQLLAGNTRGFHAVSNLGRTGNYEIEDIRTIFHSRSPIDPKITYPEAVLDAESGVLLYDTPFFQNTCSSAIHEVVAKYGLQTVAKNSKRIKFALLVNHDSLTGFGSQANFTNALQSFFNLLQNPQKFTTYLVATKVQNHHIENNIIIDGIVKFLRNVKEDMKNRGKEIATITEDDRQFLSDAQLFIEDLINNQDRIMLFREPNKIGSVMDSSTIRQSLATIRQTLLSTKHFVNVDVNDFGFTLSEKVKIYIRETLELTNNHIIEVIKLFSKCFVAKYKTFVDISDITYYLGIAKGRIDALIKLVNASQTHTEDFALDLLIFVNSMDVDNTCGNDKLINNRRLSSLYEPSKWSDCLLGIERIVKYEKDYYAMLKNFHGKLTDYEALNDDFFSGTSLVLEKFDSNNMMVDEHNYPVLMEHLGLKQYAHLKVDKERLKTINSIYLKAMFEQVESRSSFSCRNNTLVIAGNFLKLQTLDKSRIASCEQATTVALLATNKIYIDTNIGVVVLGGRNLVIIAPQWQVLGNYTLSVDGVSGGAAQPKACHGIVGGNGRAGQSAGEFIGLAARFFNIGWLEITANGGDGQDGQAGGDGMDGVDGRDGKDVNSEDGTWIARNRLMTGLYNVHQNFYAIQGDKGTSGGDAGMGGYGGMGGSHGSISMRAYIDFFPRFRNMQQRKGRKGQRGANGKPGRGGRHGCNSILEVFEKNWLTWNLRYESSDPNKTFHHVSPCASRNPDGQLISNKDEYNDRPESAFEPPNVHELYCSMSDLFQKMDDIFSHKLFQGFQDFFNIYFPCSV